ncbi:MAG TPA: epimerase [Clostridiales bacterium]|nr:epimerase [Clostridiales bacterium]
MHQITILGGKGRVGSYLVPMLLESGYAVTNVSRGQTVPPGEPDCWQAVRQVSLDRDQDGFNGQVAALGSDIVIDMICFKDDDMRQLIRALQGKVSHYIVCGSIWMHGPSTIVPCPEHLNRNPIDEYGREKNQMDLTIRQLFAANGFPGTIVHPGHIVAEGFRPVNPQGNLNLQVFRDLREGRPLTLPNFGMETLHHVHAADVAGVMLAALQNGSASFGQGFHAVSPAAVTLAGYAREVARWFNREAELIFQPYDVWSQGVSGEDAAATYDHLRHSPCCSMDKARRLLGFTPRFSSYQAIRACLDWLISHGSLIGNEVL